MTVHPIPASSISRVISGWSDDVLLLTPGPTPIHPRALTALHWPMRGHMDSDVFEYNDRIVVDLKQLYGSHPDAFAALLSGTGSLAMEAGFMNLLEAGERALVVSNGVFGDRMADMALRMGATVEVCSFPLGLPVDVSVVRGRALEFEPKVIAVVHGETSSGVLNPIPELGTVAREVDALFVVDAVTTVGMMPFRMSDWSIDYAYTGSQKCLSAPPGVAPVVFSPRAMQAIADRRSKVASWYSDALGMRDYWQAGSGARRYHHTVPVQLHWAAGEAIRAALEEGVEARALRARQVGEAVLATLGGIGFEPFVPEQHRLPTVLTVSVPVGFDDSSVRSRLRSEFGISVAGGLGAMAGRIWRLGLMGENARPEHYLRLMEALESILGERELTARFAGEVAPAA